MIKLCHQFQVDDSRCFQGMLLGRKTTRAMGLCFNGAAMIDAHPTGTWIQSQQHNTPPSNFVAFFAEILYCSCPWFLKFFPEYRKVEEHAKSKTPWPDLSANPTKLENSTTSERTSNFFVTFPGHRNMCFFTLPYNMHSSFLRCVFLPWP